MDIVVLSPTGTLRTGRNTFTIEFRSVVRRPRRCGHGARQREHDDAGHGHAGECASAAVGRAGTVYRDRRVRHGWLVADQRRMERPCRQRVRQFPGKCAMRTRRRIITLMIGSRRARGSCSRPRNSAIGAGIAVRRRARGSGARHGDRARARARTVAACRAVGHRGRTGAAAARRPSPESDAHIRAPRRAWRVQTT